MALLRSNFRTEFDAQNEGNGVSELQISQIELLLPILTDMQHLLLFLRKFLLVNRI
jgi:hypothetical protein